MTEHKNLDSAQGLSAGTDADFRHLPGAHHFDLLHHPVIYGEARWLIDDRNPSATPVPEL